MMPPALTLHEWLLVYLACADLATTMENNALEAKGDTLKATWTEEAARYRDVQKQAWGYYSFHAPRVLAKP